MKNGKKIKNVDSKNLNQELYNRYIIVNEFEKIIKNKLYNELDEGLYVFIKTMFCYEMIEDFSEFGEKVVELNYIDYLSGDKCFLCFTKFNMEDFLDVMNDWYEDVLHN
jgi:hypothetical protein